MRFEAAEMVQPHHVDLLEQVGQPVLPPAVAAVGHGFPVVERVAPALAGGAEVVGRHAGHHGRPAGGVQHEQVLAGPHLGALVGDEDRRVADDLHAAGMGMGAQRRPLSEEAPLAELPEADRAGMAGAGGVTAMGAGGGASGGVAVGEAAGRAAANCGLVSGAAATGLVDFKPKASG